MTTYTVKAGDTLGNIAKQYGLSDYSGITGYASGNPNLIQPGEVLTIPDAGAQPSGNAPVSSNQSIGELFTGSGDYSNLGDIFAKQARGEDIVDTAKIRSDKLAGMQDRINALNQVYADQMARVKQVSAGNVGSGTAILANRGLAGSLRGEAIRTGITDTNTANEKAVDTAKDMALGQVYEAVDQAVNEEAQRRREAMTSGAKNYIEFIKGQDERIKGVLNELATNYAMTGQDPSTDPNLSAIAKKLGVSTGNIIAAYKQAKYAFDAEAASGAGGVDAGGIGDGALINQPAYKNLTAKQKIQADSINNLVRSIKKYRDTIESGGSRGGINLFGADSALLQTQLNSIIFAAAQAEGTGALQQADRDVIEKIIPNLTNLKGALNNLTKGGLKGVYAKIDDQFNKYKDNLAGYGLVPSFSFTDNSGGSKTIEDYRAEFPGASDEELQALMEEEG